MTTATEYELAVLQQSQLEKLRETTPTRPPFDLRVLGAVPIVLRFRLLRLLGRLLFLTFVLVFPATFVAHRMLLSSSVLRLLFRSDQSIRNLFSPLAKKGRILQSE